MATWHDSESVQAYWADSYKIDEDVLTTYLAVAQAAVLAFAPALPDDTALEAIPDNYVLAQAIHARNLWNAAKVDPAQGAAVDDGTGFAMQPHPLDWHVKQLLRPLNGRPIVG